MRRPFHPSLSRPLIGVTEIYYYLDTTVLVAGGDGRTAIQSVAICAAAPTIAPVNPNDGDQDFVQIVFDLEAWNDI